MARINTEGIKWLEKQPPLLLYKEGKSVGLQARQGFLPHPEKQKKKQRKRKRWSDCMIQDQEWCEGNKEAVLWAMMRGVGKDPLMVFDHG